ncbi:MAG: 3-hydroxyacyl-CoA dehydrogenase NAD-binding domain-containing protein, partial [Pseudomonadota bacterium]
MNIDDIKTIGVIGAGNMGHQIVTLCAMHGYKSICTDSDGATLK